MLDLFGLGNIGTTIALVLGAIAALWGVRWSGAKDANAKRAAQDSANALERERERNEIDRNTDSANARDRLRKDWRRD